ncbi:unnamed protein product [Effrenium voratum]|uniref:Serine aminopeptidase S33 domain-containing protein n=1 Tax=Effrenium voratum TaxID=2562239 RepID=A0AA36II04_9DINO|nr:unnamed protein product [Effrenium voratum]
MTLVCTIFEPEKRPEDKSGEKACVVFCHGNAGCRLDGFLQVHCFLPLNIAVCCFDFAGSAMSGGEYVSLGYFERDDLASVVQHLRERKGYTRVGLWGRSMGATTSVLHGARDPSLAGIVADSPFSDLCNLMEEIVKSKLNLPSVICGAVFEGIRMAIQKQAGFDIREVSPLKHLDSCFVPVFFMHGDEDAFVQPHHSEILRKGWQGEATRVLMPGLEHNDHRDEKFVARATLFMVRALRWEAFIDPMALEAITKGLLPTTPNQRAVESKMNGSATLKAEEHFEQLALSAEIRKMVASREVSQRQLGLVLAAAELSGAYRGAESLSLGAAGGLRNKLPASFAGKVCFGRDDIEVAFGWVGGMVPPLGHLVLFAVLSSTALSISRVVLKPLRGGGFSCVSGVQQLHMEAVELPLNQPLEFQLFMPAGHCAQLVVNGHVAGSSEMPPGAERLECPGFVEPCCWCWRPGNSKLEVSLSKADLDPPSPRQWGRNRTATMSYGQAPKEQLAEELASLCVASARGADALPSPKHATIVYCEDGPGGGYA